MSFLEKMFNPAEKKNIENQNESGEHFRIMEKLGQSDLGKKMVGLGAGIALFAGIEAQAQEGYKVDPDAIKAKIARLKADRGRNITEARNQAIRDMNIKSISMEERNDGTTVINFSSNDGVRLNASWGKPEKQNGPSVGPSAVAGPSKIE